MVISIITSTARCIASSRGYSKGWIRRPSPSSRSAAATPFSQLLSSGVRPRGLRPRLYELGCAQTQRIFDRDGITGHIYLADAFAPPAELLGKFDYVVSLGVAGHFDDTSAALRAFSQFVKPGGVLITSVPNLVGVTGYLQTTMNKPVMDIHVPMTKEYLDNAVKQAGLETIMSKYFVSISFAATLEGLHGERIPHYDLKRFILKSMRYTSKLIWILERAAGRSLPEGRLLSAGIISAARRM